MILSVYIYTWRIDPVNWPPGCDRVMPGSSCAISCRSPWTGEQAIRPTGRARGGTSWDKIWWFYHPFTSGKLTKTSVITTVSYMKGNWQIGVGRLVSIKKMLFSGSVFIYQRVNQIIYCISMQPRRVVELSRNDATSGIIWTFDPKSSKSPYFLIFLIARSTTVCLKPQIHRQHFTSLNSPWLSLAASTKCVWHGSH